MLGNESHDQNINSNIYLFGVLQKLEKIHSKPSLERKFIADTQEGRAKIAISSTSFKVCQVKNLIHGVAPQFIN